EARARRRRPARALRGERARGAPCGVRPRGAGSRQLPRSRRLRGRGARAGARPRPDRLPRDRRLVPRLEARPVTRIRHLAELAVAVGANVQPDQIVAVGAYLGQEDMARAVAAAAYRRGARFVDVTYFDPYVKRARIAHARGGTLGARP